MIIGITGHQRLPEEEAWGWVEETIRSTLAQASGPLVGISSLAVGADQIFAALVLEHGGELRAILPFPSYIEKFPAGSCRDRYSELLARSASVEVLPALATAEESYFAAGRRVVETSDQMIAVWNGGEAAGLGGTADVVRYALQVGREVLHLDPIKKEIRCLQDGGSHG
jgi:hypothetical protein